MEVAREGELYLRQKPWNRGDLLLKPVETAGKERFYTTEEICTAGIGHRRQYLARPHSSNGFPPSEPATLLNLQTLEDFPGTANRMATEK